MACDRWVMTEITRFAPSPTGLLHLGHAFSALDAASAAGPRGVFRVRIDDLDQGRCRPEFVDDLRRDLAWLGLDWPRPERVQSRELKAYRTALSKLRDRDLIYPCFCSRSDIRRRIEGIASAPHGIDGPRYPGTCRGVDRMEARDRIDAGEAHCLRLDASKAMAMTGPLIWREQGGADNKVEADLLDDVVLARRDGAPAYHLAVVVDDAEEGVTLVTRGRDLVPSTSIHRLLISLLNLPVPNWRHHPLVLDEAGRRLAKREDAKAIKVYREAGWTPAQLLQAASAALGDGGPGWPPPRLP